MPTKLVLFATTLIALSATGFAEDNDDQPIELEVLKSSIGVWDADIEVWPRGLDAAAIKFKGVETNRAYGKYWIASDFDSEYMGQTTKVHAIVGYDLSQKKLVGTVIDHGPYSASMSGKYDKKTKAVTWITKAKGLNGKPMLQKTTVTQKSATQRVLILMVEGKGKDEFIKFMQITFNKRE